jgi:hypothetical protein
MRNFAVVYVAGYPEGQTGIGVFATVEMQAIAEGVSPLDFEPFPQTGMGDVEAIELYPTLTDGSVQVGTSTGPISVDLQVTSVTGPTDIINVAGYSVPSGTVTEDGFTIDAQTAMGALVHYCQANSIDIEITDPWGMGAFVNQIGTDAADLGNWSYAHNQIVPMVGADQQAVTNGDSVHWFNYSLNYYVFALEADKATIGAGEDITFTVTWTGDTGVPAPVDGAEVFVSDTMGAWQPDPGTSYGFTNPSGTLTLTWNQIGTFYPYAEDGARSSISQFPTPEFTCDVGTTGIGDTILHGETVSQLEMTVPDDVLSGWLLLVDTQNQTPGSLNVKSNAAWQCTVEDSDTNSTGLMTQYDSVTPAYGTLSLGDPIHVIGDSNDVTLTTGSPVLIADGIPGDQQAGNAGEDVSITFQQYVEYDDPVLLTPYDAYRIVVTFTASITI